MAPAYEHIRRGRFAEAAKTLDSLSLSGRDRHSSMLAKARVLERIGRLTQARHLANQICEHRSGSLRGKAGGEYILGRIAFAQGEIGTAVTHLQRAEAYSDQSGDAEWLFWSRIDLMRIVSQISGRNAASPLIALTRATAIKIGDPQITAAFHAYLGEIEGKSGLFDSGEYHSRLALTLLDAEPNAWLQAVAQGNRLAIAFLRCENDAALEIGETALGFAREAGVPGALRTIYANLGNVFFRRGQFEKACEYFEQALDQLAADDDNANGTLDSLARTRLAQRRYDDCERLLDKIESAITTDTDSKLYGFRHSAVTRARLLLAQGKHSEALRRADLVVKVARECNDRLLEVIGQVLRAEAMSAISPEDSVLIVRQIGDLLRIAPPDVFADYQRVVATICSVTRDAPAATWHVSQARQVNAIVGNLAGCVEIQDATIASPRSEQSAMDDLQHAMCSVIQSIAMTFFPWNTRATAAHQLVGLLGKCGCLAEDTAARGEKDGDRPNGFVNDPLFVDVHPFDMKAGLGPSAAATVNAVRIIAGVVDELQMARRERQIRDAAWTAESYGGYAGDASVSGHMEHVLRFAERVAKTNVMVLVVGESGTGKEIIARAVHDYSTRANKPFVPINCAAVPAHLLESTLFGHRRGAFTGADRDSPGLIRAANGGTVFLDEIGELGLDLQPKLLRFLESGEIAPLGEPATTRVDVRIVCATNRNLADLVQEGRFREDLFYRINVVRLALKPLRERRDEIPNLVNYFVARAAKEFGKGYLPVAEETMERLLLYRWPGNIRQLQNEIRRMIALVEPGTTLQPQMISDEILAALPLLPAATRRDEIAVSLQEKLPSAVARIETEMIKAALRDHDGRVDAVAKALGISRKGLYLKRQRLGV